MNCRFKFHKSGQPFVRAHNEALISAPMHVCNEDRSPVRIHGCDTAPTRTGFAEIVSDDFRIRHPPPQHANELKLTQQEATVMPIRSLIIFAIKVALPVGLWVTPAYAQDPAVVNSKTIRVRFENDRVRVLEAILPPGTKEQVHSHPAYVIYVLAGGRYRNYAAAGKITECTYPTGGVIYRDALTHAAENIGDKPMHMILVELKGDSGAGKSSHP